MLGYKKFELSWVLRSFEYASLINSDLLVSFSFFIRDRGYVLGCGNFHGLVFFGVLFRISDGYPYPFYPTPGIIQHIKLNDSVIKLNFTAVIKFIIF